MANHVANRRSRSTVYVGRVGALAVALGIGSAFGAPAGLAWADSDGSTDTTSSSVGSSGRSSAQSSTTSRGPAASAASVESSAARASTRPRSSASVRDNTDTTNGHNISIDSEIDTTPTVSESATLPTRADIDVTESQADSSTVPEAAAVTALAATSTVTSTPSVTVAVTKPSPGVLAPVFAPIRAITLGVLGVFGFDPNAPSGTPILEAVWGLYRRIESVFTNHAPDVAEPDVTISQVTGDTVITGNLNASDADYDTLSYTVTAATNVVGAVTINQETGAFALTAAGPGTVTFTVAVSDGTHALFGAGNTTTAAYTIAVPNQNPVISIVGSVTTSNGSTIYTVDTSDPDGDTVTVTASTPTYGSVTNNGNVTWTYTPTQAAQLAAGVAGVDGTDSFTLTASDGQGGSASTTVSGAPVIQTSLIEHNDPIAVDSFPIRMALSTDGSTLYVVNYFTQTVTVIDTASSAVSSSVSIPMNPSDIAVSADGSTLYVVGGGKASLIDTATADVTTVTLTGSATSVAVSPDKSTVYVAMLTGPSSSTVAVIDTATPSVTGTLSIDGVQLTLSSDGSTLYTVTKTAVTVYDLATDTVTKTIAVTPANSPTGIAVSSDGNTLYFTHSWDFSGSGSAVEIVDLTTEDVTVLPIAGEAYSVAFSPDGSVAYVTSLTGDAITMIDTATKTVITTAGNASTDYYARDIAVSPDGQTVYIIDASTEEVITFSFTGPMVT